MAAAVPSHFDVYYRKYTGGHHPEKILDEPMRLSAVRKHLLSAVILAVTLTTVPAMAYTGQKLAKDAKISITDARAIALKAYPGRITDHELEKKRGGSGLRYSFDIKRGPVTQEVGIDAQTGKALENKKEGPHPD